MSASELSKQISGLRHRIDRAAARMKRQAARVGKVDWVREMHKAGK